MKTYLFRVVIEPDDGRWRAYCPAPEEKGAATWGNTFEEALKNIREVVQMVVEEMLKDGEPIPEEPSGDVKVFPEVHIAVAGLG
jgi:predicted RNase H-like HicB family nuclease